MSGDHITPNFNSRNSGEAYKRLDEALKGSGIADKLATDAINGTLDDSVDIAEPSYNEDETYNIEVQLAAEDGLAPPEKPEEPENPENPKAPENTTKPEPIPEDPLMKAAEVSYSIENPNNPNPF